MRSLNIWTANWSEWTEDYFHWHAEDRRRNSSCRDLPYIFGSRN